MKLASYKENIFRRLMLKTNFFRFYFFFLNHILSLSLSLFLSHSLGNLHQDPTPDKHSTTTAKWPLCF